MSREITPQDVKRIREGMGLSQADLARLLRMGAGAARTVRHWEAGEVDRIPGPVQIALEALEKGWRPAEGISSDKRLRQLGMRLHQIEQLAREAIADLDLGDQD